MGTHQPDWLGWAPHDASAVRAGWVAWVSIALGFVGVTQHLVYMVLEDDKCAWSLRHRPSPLGAALEAPGAAPASETTGTALGQPESRPPLACEGSACEESTATRPALQQTALQQPADATAADTLDQVTPGESPSHASILVEETDAARCSGSRGGDLRYSRGATQAASLQEQCRSEGGRRPRGRDRTLWVGLHYGALALYVAGNLAASLSQFWELIMLPAFRYPEQDTEVIPLCVCVFSAAGQALLASGSKGTMWLDTFPRVCAR